MHLINKPDTEYTGQVSVSVLFHRLYFNEGKYNLSLFYIKIHITCTCLNFSF